MNAPTNSAGQRARLRSILLVVSACFAQLAQAGGEATANPDAQVAQLVTQLSSPDFRKRVSAERELAEVAGRHVGALAKAATNAPQEAGHRLLRLLELVLLKHSNATGDAAERALQELSERPGPIGAAAGNILLGNSRLIESRAREAIRSLGGEVVYVSPESFVVYRSRAVAAGTGAGFGEIGVLHSVWLYDDWKGGEEGLWHLRRLSHIPDLVVYTMSGNGIDPQAILSAAGPGASLDVEQRGGCLGIRGRRYLYSCVVDGVIPGSAADRAGLQEGDEIASLNGAEVHSFDDLVDLLKGTSAGDVVNLEIRRGNPVPHSFDEPPRMPENLPRISVEVKLGSWKEAPRGEQETVRAPQGFGGPYGPPLGDRLPPPPDFPTPIERQPTEWRP